MKKIKVLLSVMLIFTLAITLPMTALANEETISAKDSEEAIVNGSEVGDDLTSNDTEEPVEEEVMEEQNEKMPNDAEESTNEDEETLDVLREELEKQKEELKKSKEELQLKIEKLEEKVESIEEAIEVIDEKIENLVSDEDDKDDNDLIEEIEEEKEILEELCEIARKNGNTELEKKYRERIYEFKAQIKELREKMNNALKHRKAKIRAMYNSDEVKALEWAKANITKYNPNAKVLSVDSILCEGYDFKFDTPPVIKSGRTLVPIRSILNAFGAEFEWNGETREATITKDDITITLPVDKSIAYVNGEKVELDTHSQIMNSRTYVPLRFIIETLGLEVVWDGETETIELKK